MSFDDEGLNELEICHNITSVDDTVENHLEYNPNLAAIMGHMIAEINGNVTRRGLEFVQVFAQQYMLGKGLKKFGERGENATYAELEQLHKRTCFSPIHIAEMTKEEKKKAQNALLLLTEKRTGEVKGRLVYNGKPTRDWMSREDTSSPTATQEGIFLTAVIDAKEERDIVTADIPNAFVQTKMNIKNGDKKIVMKISGKLVDMLLAIAPEIYGGYVVYKNGKRYST